jgi:branched-chain amino acid transport system substrate-binding protein
MVALSHRALGARKAGMRVALALAATAVLLAVSPALAQEKYDPGASDTEIKIGQTMPYSGPASGFGISARVAAAYYEALNDHGGINERKIAMISLDGARWVTFGEPVAMKDEAFR